MGLDRDLRGSCREGYTSEDFERLSRVVFSATGVQLRCIWAFVDDWGYGGDSEFYIEDSDGGLFELSGDLIPWLQDDSEDSPRDPGAPETWIGPRSAIAVSSLAGDGFGNYALTSR